jgi:hypothetical protein
LSPHRKIARSLGLLIFVLAVMLVMALGQRTIRRAVALIRSPVGAAQWIWAPRAGSRQSPLAFYAVRDFELSAMPDSALLLCLADESYVLHLNGQMVGAGRYSKAAPLDAYDVTALMRPGLNRLVVELRSSRGVGALLASLRIEGPEETREITTGRDWRIFWRYRRTFFVPEDHLPGGAAVRVWGPPPAGRWRTPPSIRERPTFAAQVGQLAPVAPHRVWTWNDGEWKRERGYRPGRPVPLQGSVVLFEWEREVEGYLVLKQRRAGDLPALLFVGDSVPTPDDTPPSASVVFVPSKKSWQDAVVRRFRFALVVGLNSPLGATVQPVDEALMSELMVAPGPTGVFGLDPPLLRTPVEDEVWRHVEGFPGPAVREHG